ncbi:MAG: hypothetical protein EGR51_03565 [Oscillibacter sp.]|nr:hypothetical protein [Oscillibacter sp.]
MAAAEESIRGKTRPDMSRNEGLAGQTVTKGDYEYTYDDNGYAKKAINVKNRQEREQEGYGGGGYSGGGDSSYYDSLQPTDLSGYLNDMYKAYTDAQLAALKSAYEQNLAGLQADAEKIPGIYQGARNEAASQNDIARMAFNEYANARGLNTGTSGQAALANSAVLQSNLTDISTKESDAIAENALQQQQLAIEYRNAAVQAQAEGNYQMAQALYNEYVRQDNAAMQTAQLAQEQANWEAQFSAGNSQWQQFDASQQEYQDSLSAQNREYAYNLAMTMLAAGVMPDTNTLNEAGISTADALNMRLAAMSTGGSGGGRRSSGNSGNSSNDSNNTTEDVPGPGIQAEDFQSQLMALSSYLSRASGSRLNSQSYRDSQFEKAKDLYKTLYSQANATQRERLDSLVSSYGIS